MAQTAKRGAERSVGERINSPPLNLSQHRWGDGEETPRLPKGALMGMSRWIDQHLEEFVRPVLGHVPSYPTIVPPLGVYNHHSLWLASFNPATVKAYWMLWEAAKKKSQSRKIFLPGRDTWILEVMARLDGYPTIFRPDISSKVVNSGLVTEDYGETYLVDSGYKGSIAVRLGIPHFGLVAFGNCVKDSDESAMWPAFAGDPRSSKVDAFRNVRQEYQLIPEMHYTLAAGLVCIMEQIAHYWKSGEVVGDKIVQELDDTALEPWVGRDGHKIKMLSPFEIAAQVTMHVAKTLDKNVAIDITRAHKQVRVMKSNDNGQNEIIGYGTAPVAPGEVVLPDSDGGEVCYATPAPAGVAFAPTPKPQQASTIKKLLSKFKSPNPVKKIIPSGTTILADGHWNYSTHVTFKGTASPTEVQNETQGEKSPETIVPNWD